MVVVMFSSVPPETFRFITSNLVPTNLSHSL